MSENMFTPGPWKIGTEREMGQQVTMSGIAISAHARKYDADCAIFNMRHNDTFGGIDVTCANARLIAAAPDLLAALTELLEAFDGCPDDLGFGEYDAIVDGAVSKARAAIKAARGKS